MNERRQLLYVILVCAFAALTTSAFAIYLLYTTALDSAADQLQATVKSQARLIEAMAQFDAQHDPHARPPELPNEVLDEIVDSFSRYEGIGKTGEFLIARREGDNMVYQAKQRPGLQHPRTVPFHGTVAEPMRRALSGRSGTLIARDYRGEAVLAAHEAVRGWNLGIVAKIDLAEVRAPFVRAGAVAGALAITTVLLCALMVLRVTNPIIRRLQESEARIKTIVDSIADSIITIDDTGTVKSFSAGAERMFGYAQAEVIGRNVSLLMPEPYHSEHDTYLRNYVHTGMPRVIGLGCRASARRKDGSVFPIELTVNEMRLNGKRKFVGIIHDVTERRRVEDVLRENEARLNEAQHIAHIGSWELDLVRNHLAWSEEIFRIFEIDSQRFGASYEAFLDAVHPDDRAAVNHAYTESVKNRTPYEIMHRLRMPDGRIKYVHERCMTYYSESGAPLRSLGTVQDITERVLADEALRESERRFHTLARIAPVGIFRTDAKGDCVYVNERWCEIAGLTPAQARGSGWAGAIHAEDRDCIFRRWYECAQNDMLFHEECRMQRPDGVVTWVFAQAAAEYDAQGAVLGYVGSVTDISEHRRAEAQMRKLSRALEQTADAVMITDRNGIVEYVNPAFESTTGYRCEEVLGHKPNLIKSGKQGADFYRKLWQTILAGEVFSEVFVNRRKDGTLYYEEKTITPLKDERGGITHFVATGKDISERMQAQERLQFMAQHDVLTELPNRALFLDRLKQSLARARWHERLVAVLFLDLDRFKNINDTLGHQAGDQLLQAIGQRLGDSVREGDTVARLGGDEFAVLLDDVASDKDISLIAQKILENLKPAFVIEGRELFVSASIGISLYPGDGEDLSTLLRNADVAMYRAKDLGKNTYQFYSSEMSARAFERLTLESSLRHALEREEFLLYYQPQVDARTREIVGVEALLRWQHPDIGLVSPVDFIPILEESGLIIPVGEWVLQKACEQARAWQRDGHPALRLAVNLSARQFNEPGLVALVERVMKALDYDPALLELEITESVIMRHVQTTVDAFEAFNRMGVQLAVDDFGTGYSSLSYLRRFPIDTLKIDRSFIRDIPHDPDDTAIASAIIMMARSLKLRAIAEGVETAAQHDFLRAQGCELMQGFLFSRPLPAEEVTRLLAAAPRG